MLNVTVHRVYKGVPRTMLKVTVHRVYMGGLRTMLKVTVHRVYKGGPQTMPKVTVHRVYIHVHGGTSVLKMLILKLATPGTIKGGTENCGIMLCGNYANDVYVPLVEIMKNQQSRLVH